MLDYWHDLLNKEGFDGTGLARDWFMQNSTDTDRYVQFSPEFDVYGPVTLDNPMCRKSGSGPGSDLPPGQPYR